jgi:hypothetical protein
MATIRQTSGWEFLTVGAGVFMNPGQNALISQNMINVASPKTGHPRGGPGAGFLSMIV